MDPESPVEQLQAIADRAHDFFTRATLLIGESPEDDLLRVQEPEMYWDELTVELRAISQSLGSALAGMAPRMAGMVQASPLLTEADELDLGAALKEMRAALALRHYVHWDVEVLHDEGRVLGVQPPGQSDDEPLRPDRAEVSFQRNTIRLTSMLELASAGDAAGSPAADAPVRLGVTPGMAFIMMWMDADQPSLDDVSDTVKRCFEQFGIRAVRSDDIQHEDLITKRILDQIRTAEFLFADLSGERPSVYYEVGFAHAIGRRVILFRRRGAKIHFDLAGYNCPEYENLRDLEEQLHRRLQSVTGESPRGGTT